MVKKNRVDASKNFDFAPISSKQMISPRTVEKPLNILKKRVVFSIWRAEKWKFIAGDWIKRFSLIVRNFSQDFYQKIFIKILKIFEKHFHFLDGKFENFWKISTFFVFDPSKMTLDFSFENEKSWDFSKKTNFQSKKK